MAEIFLGVNKRNAEWRIRNERISRKKRREEKKGGLQEPPG